MTESFLAPKIVIINTRAANVHSVDKALRKVGANPVITSDPEELASADAAVLPGVGASDAVMTALNSLGLTDPVKQFATSGRPLLCICIGLQVLFNSSEEGDLPGLGLVQGSVKLIPPGMKDKLGNKMKVPHIGWNEVHFTDGETERNPIFRGIPQGSHFYFVHSYRCVPDEQSEVAATANYGVEVCAAVVRRNVIGTQFHPEKSGSIGLQIYKNFFNLSLSTKNNENQPMAN